jgi:DNA-binding LacI/PurR family transcriptional regulator
MARVSQATVSLVLNGNPSGVSLSAQTQQRVLDAARELGYVPDPAARRLVARHNRLLGLHTFMPTFPVDFRNSYYPFLVGVEEEAAEQGYDLLLFTGTGTDRPRTGGELNRLRLADGCVLIGRHAPTDELVRLLDDGFPLVYIGRNDTAGSRLAYVGADYVRASADVVAHLVGLGHRRLRYVREHDDAVASVDREIGFRLGLEETGAAGDVVRSDGSDLTTQRLRSWLHDGVTAVITEASDTQAATRAVHACVEAMELSCPLDLSLAMLGDDVHPEPGTSRKVVTGFAIPRREMGRRAARMLVHLLADQPVQVRQELLPCPFVTGETTGPPR